MSLDPINTTAQDGAACDLCGEDATGIDLVNGQRVITCTACHHDQITECASECGAVIFQKDGIRLYGNSGLHCQSCSASHPTLILGRHHDARIDERKG